MERPCGKVVWGEMGKGEEKYAEHFAGQVESFELLLLPLLHAHFVCPFAIR